MGSRSICWMSTPICLRYVSLWDRTSKGSQDMVMPLYVTSTNWHFGSRTASRRVYRAWWTREDPNMVREISDGLNWTVAESGVGWTKQYL
jgi:hypothetical protein